MGVPLAFAGFAPADELALVGLPHPIEGADIAFGEVLAGNVRMLSLPRIADVGGP